MGGLLARAIRICRSGRHCRMSGGGGYLQPVQPNLTCGSVLPFEPGPKMVGARCERMAHHSGPHCWRGPAEDCTMWSGGEPIVTPHGRSLVTLADLTDDDGQVWR